MQARITIDHAMADDPTLPPLFRPIHIEIDITPQSCSTNSGMSRHLGDIYKALEKLAKYAMLEEDTPIMHPSIVAMINAGAQIRQAQQILDGPPMVAAPAGPQMVPRKPH